jgi:NitT/TauT family transport system substrate-binding protein
MGLQRALLLSALPWIVVITLLHGVLNIGWGRQQHASDTDLRVGFLPVACHLTCPVNHFIQTNLSGAGQFTPQRFSGWPELKEAFLSGHTEATFILAPMAMKLREDGVKLKVVYLGHRDGTALVVRKDSSIHRIEDLRGRRVAVPNRYSNQRLLLFKVLKERGLSFKDIDVVEMAPPDMPASLYARAVDAITSGEPFMGLTELDGYGRVLYLTKDVWPNFISCVLAVREDVIARDRARVQALVDGIAKSGAWIDKSMDHRMEAAQFVSANYYNQDPRLLEFVLAKPPDRVKYTNLSVRRPDFEEIAQLGREAGILDGTVDFLDYADTSFVKPGTTIEAYPFEHQPSIEKARVRGTIR